MKCDQSVDTSKRAARCGEKSVWSECHGGRKKRIELPSRPPTGFERAKWAQTTRPLVTLCRMAQWAGLERPKYITLRLGDYCKASTAPASFPPRVHTFI